MQNISQHVELIQNLKNKSNEVLLKIYETLDTIEETNAWKSKTYYERQDTFDFKQYSKMAFSSFIKEVFGISELKFKFMQNILSLDNGKELFLKHGRSNMVTYYHSTDEERKAILNVLKKEYRLSPFSTIKRELYPSIRKAESNIINPWKEKYEKMKKERDQIKKEFNDYKKEVGTILGDLKKVA